MPWEFDQEEKLGKEPKLDQEQNPDQKQKLGKQREVSKSWTARKTTGVEVRQGTVAISEIELL